MGEIMEKKKWMGDAPEKCDLCGRRFGTLFPGGRTIFIDGRTKQGPWGLLCGPCHCDHGVGLGEGDGQMYDLETREKIK